MSKTLPTEQQRQHVAERSRHHCEYCRCPETYALQSFECEHIVPLSRGGTNNLENLAWSCGGCNRLKSSHTEGVDPQSNEWVVLYHPRLHQWEEHFIWGDDLSMVFGITATGRATVDVLRLNRPGVVNLRQLLILIDKHPPSF